MPKYRFGWDAFDDATVEAVARDCGIQGGDPRELLKRRWARPDEELVRLSKKTLERTWLLDYPMMQTLVRELLDSNLGPMNQPLSREEHIDYVVNCRNTSRFRRILLEHLLKFGEGRPFAEIADGSILGYAAMRVGEQPADPRKPFPYQQEAWNALSACLARSGSRGGFPGLLVMPTGSGKTFTAVHWLMENIIARGMRVMWVAHREVLLEQAWHEFKRLAHLAATSGRSELMTMRIVSGKYDSASMLTPDDHVMLCSVASLARHRAVVQNILRDPKVFLVIDEAHHAPAKSYLDIIRYMKSLKNNQLLGLTATPTRMSDSEATVLSSVFNNNIVYQAALGDLIERGYLARPKKIRVFTDVDVEAQMTAEERQHLARFYELSEETLDRIGRLDERNNLIVGHYIENKAKYGKTLVFATRVDHAALLREKFRAQGVEAAYITSHSPDGEATNIDAVRERFSEPGSGLDVLINVQMLTEGVDIPAVQTVLLARPTNSAVLMQQMIGRALRGTKAGGTDTAYLVSFEDHWERFSQFERPFTLVPSLAGFEEETTGAAGETEDVIDDAELQDGVASVLPLEVFREVAATLSRLRDSKAQVFEAIPCGWYLLTRPEEGEDDVMQMIPVFVHDKPCWDAVVSYVNGLTTAVAAELDASELYDDYFGDCDIPRPSIAYLEQLIQHQAAGGAEPSWEDLAQRSRVDPAEVATEILDQDLGRRQQQALIEERYESDLARAIYHTLRDYWEAVDEAVRDLQNPGGVVRMPPAIPVFDPLPTQMMSPGPAHDLRELMDSVLRRGAELMELKELPGDGIQLKWTHRPIKTWFACAYWGYATAAGVGEIRVSAHLDSPDISRETMEYLLWHEYLHLLLKQLHTKEFRRLERLWPTFVEGDRELDTLNERFGVRFW